MASRAAFPASGPVIICERTGRPWGSSKFRARWRKIAQAAGIPDTVQNRDSRSGASSEAWVAGVPRDDRRRMLGHSAAETTDGYDRATIDVRRNIAKLRAEKRNG